MPDQIAGWPAAACYNPPPLRAKTEFGEAILAAPGTQTMLPLLGDDPRSVTLRLTRGVCRLMDDMGYGALTEFRLTGGRRVDVIALNDAGEFVIVEIKSTVEDYRADRKWQEYLPYCERFYFAVAAGFPLHLLPAECGLIVADGFGAAVRRQPPTRTVNGGRKRRQLVRFGLAASARLQRTWDSRA